ncbi:hypothetical protein AMJ85_00075 [candidate division BRC1 bacterium SM23_51]|nr:MAG: hypothetical protein AMJ85_00075 [candidate division BRC1 bacterium SM23_51]
MVGLHYRRTNNYRGFHVDNLDFETLTSVALAGILARHYRLNTVNLFQLNPFLMVEPSWQQVLFSQDRSQLRPLNKGYWLATKSTYVACHECLLLMRF